MTLIQLLKFSEAETGITKYPILKRYVSKREFSKRGLHTVLWQLYIENQKHIPNFWIYDVAFYRHTTLHVEDCPNPMSFFVNPV